MRNIIKNVLLQILLVIATLGVIEGVLRAVDLRYLRMEAPTNIVGSVFRFDPELGWAPSPNSVSTFMTPVRTITVRNNSLGLRDIEQDRTSKPVILVIGDSFVWGYNVNAEERFTEILRKRFPDYAIVNAGVAGYGTDQEYLMLRRLWARWQPSVVLLGI